MRGSHHPVGRQQRESTTAAPHAQQDRNRWHGQRREFGQASRDLSRQASLFGCHRKFCTGRVHDGDQGQSELNSQRESASCHPKRARAQFGSIVLGGSILGYNDRADPIPLGEIEAKSVTSLPLTGADQSRCVGQADGQQSSGSGSRWVARAYDGIPGVRVRHLCGHHLRRRGRAVGINGVRGLRHLQHCANALPQVRQRDHTINDAIFGEVVGQLHACRKLLAGQHLENARAKEPSQRVGFAKRHGP